MDYIIQHLFDPDNDNNSNNELDPCNSKYHVKWKGYSHRHDSRVRYKNFTDPQFVKEYLSLTKKQKQKRLKQYQNALKAEQKKAKQHLKVAGLTETKIKKKCMHIKYTII